MPQLLSLFKVCAQSGVQQHKHRMCPHMWTQMLMFHLLENSWVCGGR